MGRGDLDGAATAAAACRRDWPDAAAGWLLGSIAALLSEDTDTALALIDERLATDPANVQCLLQKAECLLAGGDRANGLACAAAAAAHARGSAVSLDAVGELLFHAGDYPGALCAYDGAVAVAPGNPALLAKRADVKRVLGDMDGAAVDYRAALAVEPHSPRALKGLVDIQRQSPERNCLAGLRDALACVAADSVEAGILHFGLAKSLDDLGLHAESWRHLCTGNRIEHSRLHYDADRDRAFMQQVIAEFPGPEPSRPDATGARPIFIVGVPRTGTTLVERIVGMHSEVYSAGELNAFPEALNIASEGGSRRLSDLDPAVVAREYLARSNGLRGDRPRFTDKLLTNFFHCALLLRAFPNAHIVHVTRHPLAACLAIYRTRFNGTYPFAYDLEELGQFYGLYHRLMQHWRTVLPGRIVDVAYEDVVTAVEPTTRALLNRVGLPFEARCLEFQRNAAPVKTTSSAQVRQGLYASSLDAWRNYQQELAPLRAQLESIGIQVP
jgi:tetratricopeptide (TPR) repeat protein